MKKEMRIILINPPPLLSDGSPNVVQSNYPPLGLLYIAAVVEKAGYEISVCDASINEMNFEQIRKRLGQGYDIIGIAAFTGTRESAYLCASIAKEENEQSIVVLGGPHATFLSEITLRTLPSVDVIVRGEGELTFLELVKKIWSGMGYQDVRGISYRKDGSIIHNPSTEVIGDLDLLPFPARHLVPMNRYLKLSYKTGYHLRRPATTIITSRGCPGSCMFCSTPAMWGRRFRRRTPEKVVDEIEHLHHNYGVNEVFFMDDTFTFSEKWVKSFCNRLMQSNLDISWRCLGRVDTVNPDLLATMKKAGCYLIEYGIESGSQKMLNIIGKGATPQQAAKAIKLTKDVGIFVDSDLIIGLPDENEEDLEQTCIFIRENHLDNFALLVPWILPGSALYMRALEEGKIDDMFWFKPFRHVIRSVIQPPLPIYINDRFSNGEELLSKWRQIRSQVRTYDFLKRNMNFKRRVLPVRRAVLSLLATKNPKLFVWYLKQLFSR